MLVFGFPVTMSQAERINHRAVNAHRPLLRSLEFPFRNEHPTELTAAGFEQVLKGAADCRFMRDAYLSEFAERIVVSENRFMIRFQIELLHAVLSMRRSGYQCQSKEKVRAGLSLIYRHSIKSNSPGRHSCYAFGASSQFNGRVCDEESSTG